MQEDYEAEYIGDDTPPESHQEGVERQEETEAPSYEAEARKQGWKPQDEFPGPAEKWRPADEFVERGNRDPAILRSRVEKLDRANEALQRRLEEQQQDFGQRFDRLSRTQEMALQRQREQLESQFSSVKRQAVDTGDTELYDRVEQQERETRKAWADEDKQQQEPVRQREAPQTPAVQPEVKAWIDRNSTWYNKDPVLTDEAEAFEEYLAKTKPGLSLEERLEETRKHVVNQFPHKFGRKPQMNGNGQQRSGSPVDGGQRQPGSSGDDHGFSQLPSEARQQFKTFVKEGVFEDTAAARSEYAKYYIKPNADHPFGN